MTHAAHHPDDEAVDRFAAELKAKLADARAKGRGGWEDKAQVSAQALSDMLLAHVFKGDPRDVANFAMFLHQRGESIALADGPRMEHAVEVFQIAEQRCAEHHAGAGRLIEPGIAVQAGLIAAAPFLIGASPAPVAGGYRGVSWRANGEANSYHLLRGGRWLAHILMNGELFVGQQTDMMERIVIALGGPAQHGGADILQMALGFEANAEKRLRSKINLQNGGVQFEFVEDEDKDTRTKMQVFERFTLGLPVFDGSSNAYPLEARLKYREREGKVTFWYELIRPDRVFKSAVTDELTRIKEITGFPVISGKP